MAAHEHINKYQLRYRPTGGDPFTDDFHHEIQAVDKDTKKRVGTMQWTHTGRLWEIEVDYEHRRKGLATAMWNFGEKIATQNYGKGVNKHIPVPEHSVFRTPAGDAWAKSTGDPVPDIVFEQYENTKEAYRDSFPT